jgi:cytochrome oxidase Cu insertion factor (SCO1/SenC/PrrC family)
MLERSLLMTALPRHILMALILLACAAGGFAWLGYQTSSLGRTRASLEKLGHLEPFNLTDQTGAPFPSSRLNGRIWVADFIFTRCLGPCPLMSAKMAKLQESLRDLPDVTLVSFSVDPVADTPPVLEAYAQKYKPDPDRWTFLTGDVHALYDLIQRGFKLPVGATPPPDRVEPGELITHTTRFVLVDRDGDIRGYFDSEEAGFLTRIEEAVRALH